MISAHYREMSVQPSFVLRFGRTCLSLIAGLVALLCGVMALEAPTVALEDRAEQRAKLRSFDTVAAYVKSHHDQTGSFPTAERIRDRLDPSARYAPHLALNTSVDGDLEDGSHSVGCSQDKNFTAAADDTFVLSSW